MLQLAECWKWQKSLLDHMSCFDYFFLLKSADLQSELWLLIFLNNLAIICFILSEKWKTTSEQKKQMYLKFCSHFDQNSDINAADFTHHCWLKKNWSQIFHCLRKFYFPCLDFTGADLDTLLKTWLKVLQINVWNRLLLSYWYSIGKKYWQLTRRITSRFGTLWITK